jgi:Domain of unknown function (DUF6456)
MHSPTPPVVARSPRRAKSSRKKSQHPKRLFQKATERLLATLAERGAVAHGGAAAETLIRADLAIRRPDGMIEITTAGHAHLIRLQLARIGTVDPFLGQHIRIAQGETETPMGRARVTLDACESPLAWLARRKARDGRALIEPVQLQAGERLRADFTCAHMMPRVTTNWATSVVQDRLSGGVVTFTEAALAARQRVRHALHAVGPEFTGLLLDVCCFLKGLDDVERERGWPTRSAKVVLQLGLDRLARHYGYAAEARGADAAHVRTWLAPDAAFAVGE